MINDIYAQMHQVVLTELRAVLAALPTPTELHPEIAGRITVVPLAIRRMATW